ncbi:PadR family transcriptional regulator [Erwinia sp. CPCC 100877]|nr:PadR family transcriptional regulator [Erwinia sp. CPCC 100877]
MRNCDNPWGSVADELSHEAPHHGRGDRHGKRPRFFGHGELRLLILDILTHGASHGYELIKAIEGLTGGHYAPSPGVIYPTLDLLARHQCVNISEEEGGRKRIAITPEGETFLEANREDLSHIHQRLKDRAVGHQLRKNPQMKRALENFKAVLNLQVNQGECDETRLKRIVAIIDLAAQEIAQLE